MNYFYREEEYQKYDKLMKAGIPPLLGQRKGSLGVALKGGKAFPRRLLEQRLGKAVMRSSSLLKGNHSHRVKPCTGFLDAQDERPFVRGALVLYIVSVQRVRRLFGGATAAARNRASV